MNLALEKMKRVTIGGKSRGEMGNEIGKVTGMTADVPTTDSLEKKMEFFCGWEMAAGEIEILLVGLMWTEVQKPSLLTSR